MDESFKSLNSAGSRYSRASNNSIKSQGVRGGFASRNLKYKGSTSFNNDLFDRKYDSVAESLYRIQTKLQQGKQRRNFGIKERVSRLSAHNQSVDNTKTSWNADWEKTNEESLYNNCKKAQLMEKKVKKKEKMNMESAKKWKEKLMERKHKSQGVMNSNKEENAQYHKDLRKRHQQQEVNAEKTKRILLDINEERKESNFLRKYDHSANKYREDVKSDNFKRHIIYKHSLQNFQVLEKNLNK